MQITAEARAKAIESRRLRAASQNLTKTEAIAAKCRDCIHDPCESGTWREQVRNCTSNDCALWEHRPR